VLSTTRERQIQIAFTRIVYQTDGSDAGVFAKKLPTLLTLTEDRPASQVVDELRPLPGEDIIRKIQASGFFGTDLADRLRSRDADTLLVTGCTTSGCIRAAVVDGIAYNFTPVVICECVGDRAIEPHETNLFDMQQKYADIVSRDAAIQYLRTSDVGMCRKPD
jgi:maleamate amidohydrolase